jgi:hypothetical protein
MNAAKTFEEIKTHAESIKNDETQTLGETTPGDTWAQGDLAIVCLKEVPKDAEVQKAERQLAIGNTQGARHCFVSLDGITSYKLKDAGPLDGPVFEAKQGCEIDHPEHGNLKLPAGVYGCIYQRQFAEELRRVLD